MNHNQYIVNIARDGRRLHGGRIVQMVGAVRAGEKVEFANHFPVDYPDVSRYLLQVHAALAEVFHMTGWGERYDEEIFRDGDAIIELAGDGTDWDVLFNRLAILA